MTVTIELRPETEARLSALAAGQGMSLAQFARRVLEDQVPAPTPLSPAERAALWRDSAKRLPRTPPLSDEGISRECIYAERG